MKMKLIQQAIKIYHSEGAFPLARSIAEFLQWNSQRTVGNYYRTKKYKLLYGDAAPDPYEVIYVNPNNIEYMIVPALRYKYSRFGTYVLDGDWDKQHIDTDFFSTFEFKNDDRGPALLPFSEYGLYQSIRSHFLEDVPWKDTEWYRHEISNTEQYGGYDHDSKEAVLEYFNQIDSLYNKIKDEGYKSQKDLPSSGRGGNLYEQTLDEILIDIDRNGRLLFEDGRHRLSIAKVLDLEQIPVRVLVRHADWQKTRSRIASQETAFETQNQSNISRNHPDLHML